MQKITTAAQMRNMDRIAMHGVYAMAPAVLMENAGHAVAERAGAWLDGWDGKDVVLFCGKGNNGGDGFVIARHILAAGARVYVYVLGKEEDYSDEARQHLHTLQQLAFAYAIERLQVHRSEDDPRYVQTVQVSGQLFRFHPWCGKHLERNGIPHADRHIS